MTEATTEASENSEIQSSDVAPREYTQVEKEEMARGWKPEGTKTAEEFRAYRDEYNNSLQRIQTELKETKKSMDFLLKQNAKIAEEGYQRALTALKKEQEEAAYLGDVATVNKKTQEIVNLEKNQVQQLTQNEEVPQEYLDFVERHKSWFVKPGQQGTAKNIAYTQYAQQREVEILNSNPNASHSEIIALLEQDIRHNFPGLIRESQESSIIPRSKQSAPSELNYDGLSDFHKQVIAYNKANIKNFDETSYIKEVQRLRNSRG